MIRDRRTPRNVSARLAAALAATLGLAALAGCSPTEERLTASLAPDPAGTAVLAPDDPAAAALGASERLFAASDLVFVAADPAADALVDDAVAAGAPLLVTGPALAGELERLGARVVVHAEGDVPEGLDGGIRLVPIDAALPPAETGAPALERVPADGAAEQGDGATGAPGVALYTADGEAPPALAATVEAAGGTRVALPGGDPRAGSATVADARAHAAGTVLAYGDVFDERFGDLLAHAAVAPELPGGGQLALHERMYVADYGHPGAPVLGVLGERDLEEAIAAVKSRADEYAQLTGLSVVPTFELITTIASAGPGADGDYSSETPVEALRPWVERAGEEGVYVVLDLQPGTAHFLDQAKRYEELLVLPHVGLALDPEWKLQPGQRHMVQIGSVGADEVNETIAWLADLTAEHELPQKLLVLHQFSLHMLEERERIDTSRDELAVLLHADGHGSPGEKFETWETLLAELPEGMAVAWKNFIDEDTPTFTPAETLAIEPAPLLVTYQ